MRTRVSTSLRPILVALFSASLAACGGGGGSSSSSTPAPTTPPPPVTPPPVSSEDLNTAAKFLTAASFGPTFTEIEDLAYSNQSAWFRAQLAETPTLHLNTLLALDAKNFMGDQRSSRDSFWRTAAGSDDQLRQRMAYALSQILVVSESRTSALNGQPLTMAHYMDVLTRNALGNYRDLLEEVTYSPAMATYLTYLRNRKGNMNTGRVPDENYARELMQLFTIGLVELNLDGTMRLDGNGQPIETYNNSDITGLARVFTGLSFNAPNFWNGREPLESQYAPLIMFDSQHSELEKRFLDTVIPPATDGDTSIDLALDALFNHPNMAPFLGRQLIQRFTTSNPSSAYIGRVSAAFESGQFTLPDGSSVGDGRRGDLAATLAAILFDPEAQIPEAQQPVGYGKVREPVIRFLHWARAFNVNASNSDNELLLQDSSNPVLLAQQAYMSPSVFNFYRPGYVAPGTQTGAAGLVAPELQILSETSAIGYSNFMGFFVRDDAPGGDRANGQGWHADYSNEIPLADDPAALLDRLDLMLTQGRLRTSTRDRITDVINRISLTAGDEETARRNRVHTAVLMVVTSPEFMVQR